MAKRLYTVSVPFTGVATTQVEVDDDQDPLEVGMLYIGDKLRFERTLEVDVEWDLTEKIVMGNVFCGVQNEASVEDEGSIDGEEDDDEQETEDGSVSEA
jgi:hypothetical protein